MKLDSNYACYVSVRPKVRSFSFGLSRSFRASGRNRRPLKHSIKRLPIIWKKIGQNIEKSGRNLAPVILLWTVWWVVGYFWNNETVLRNKRTAIAFPTTHFHFLIPLFHNATLMKRFEPLVTDFNKENELGKKTTFLLLRINGGKTLQNNNFPFLHRFGNYILPVGSFENVIFLVRAAEALKCSLTGIVKRLV